MIGTRRVRRVRRTGRVGHAAVACAGAVALASLTGCTVPVAGVAGITVTEDGRAVGVLMVCHDHIDGAGLYVDHSDDTEWVATWSRTPPATGFVTWPLATGGGAWTVDDPMPAALEPGRTYTLYGWTDDSSWSTADVSFTPALLAGLEPGQVRYYAGEVRGADRDGYLTVPVARFRAEACRDV
jgi:hypothetical protein